MKKIILFTAVIIVFFSLTLGSCKKSKTETPVPQGTLLFHFHTNVDTAEVEYNTTYALTGGRKISVSMAQLIISGIQLIKADGSIHDVPNANILVRQDEELYIIGNVPAGDYKTIKFNVGLSPATNASTPGAGDSVLNKPEMWFGASAQPAGFVFVNFQGKIDTTAAGNGTVGQMQLFSYKIGTNMNLKTITMPAQNYTVSADQMQYEHLIIDYSKLFSGVQLNVNSNLIMNTTSANAGTLGMQIANNITSMFKYE